MKNFLCQVFIQNKFCRKNSRVRAPDEKADLSSANLTRDHFTDGVLKFHQMPGQARGDLKILVVDGLELYADVSLGELNLRPSKAGHAFNHFKPILFS